MRFGSVCSGIEAASVAFGPLGWKAAWFSEIEPFPSAVLAHHYPDTPNLGDMTAIEAAVRAGVIEAPDMLCGGTPCQAFSVAGLRRSLADARGNLSLAFVELANAVDDVRADRGEPAAVVLWENVPGVLATTDNAFGCFLAGLAGCDKPIDPGGDGWTNAGVVLGPRRVVCWRVLDAQYFGLAQRRRRVFVVASARDGFDPVAVLLESEGMRRDSPPSREAGQGTARGAIPSVAGSLDTECGGGKLTHQSVKNGHLIGTITARMFNSLGARDVEEGALLAVDAPDAYSIRTANTSSNGWGVQHEVTHTLDQAQGLAIAHTLKSEGFDASEGGTGRGTPLIPVDCHGVMPTMLNGANTPAGHMARSGHNKDAYIVPVAMAFAQNQRDEVREMEVAGALAAEPGMKQQTYLAQAMAVRRLTPRECERLQGFRDDYTAIPWRGKPADECPDGPRYKALGNSWAVPCVAWIGRRIQASIEAAA